MFEYLQAQLSLPAGKPQTPSRRTAMGVTSNKAIYFYPVNWKRALGTSGAGHLVLKFAAESCVFTIN